MTDRELMQAVFKAIDSVNDFSSGSLYAGVFDYEVKLLRERLAQLERNDGIQLKNIEHPISLGDASDYKFSSESIEEGWLQREWQGLTEDDIREFEIWLDDEEERRGWNPPEDIAKYLEAKLREKNT